MRSKAWPRASRSKARGRSSRFLAFAFVPLVLLIALALWPAATVWGVTASLCVLFVPLIGFRPYGLFASASGGDEASCPRLPDRVLPIYTLLVPLYREAHMLPALVRALSRLDIRRRSSTSRSFSRRAIA